MRTTPNTSPAPRSVLGPADRRDVTESVDDAVADTFTIAYERRGRFDTSHVSALPWLYGIATNVLRRYRAAEARYRKLIRHDGEASAEGAAVRAVARADAGTAIRALAGELDKISRRQRDVLHLYAAGCRWLAVALNRGPEAKPTHPARAAASTPSVIRERSAGDVTYGGIV